jgi:pyruvate carboxylase subunit B
MTTIRNFDALNDIRNLKYSGERISHHGLKHQIVITVMELPPGCEGAHTTEFYLESLRELLDSEIPHDSICFKDATGTANPRKIYNTIKGARKMCPAKTTLWFHTHDTAGIGITQNLAAIEGGADGVDLSKSPVSGGTAQPDILSMVQVLKGTDYTLDIDVDRLMVAEEVFEQAMEEYFYPPEAKMTSPKIIFSPMPGGALTANTMMMRDTKTLNLYGKVIGEMTQVIKLGGFGSSVTPVSQFYFQQAYLNVTLGRWKRINPNYGNMVLGYFGKTPVPADPEVIKLAAAQLGKPVFKDDPLDVLEPGIPKARKILEANNLSLTDENIFIIASCETKGLDYLLGKGKATVRKKETESEPIRLSVIRSEDGPSGQSSYAVTFENKKYSILVSKNQNGVHSAQVPETPVPAPQSFSQPTVLTAQSVPASPASFTPTPSQVSTLKSVSEERVTAQIPGKILQILTALGDRVADRQTLLIMEAMKMETEVKATKAGVVSAIHVAVGDAVQTADVLISLS